MRVPHGLGMASDPATDAMIALGGEVAAPIHAEGVLAGVLVLGPKRSGMPFDDEEVAFLGALGSVSTLALRSAEIQATLESLNRELRDKVEKIAEQRRRILVLQDQLAQTFACRRARGWREPRRASGGWTGRRLPGDQGVEQGGTADGGAGGQGGGQSLGRVDPRRKRHGQGASGGGDSQGQPQIRAAVRQGALRGSVAKPAGERALRPCRRGLHRRGSRPRGSVSAGRWRHAVPGRNRRHQLGRADEAVASASRDGVSRRWAARRRSPSTCGCWPPRTRIWKP